MSKSSPVFRVCKVKPSQIEVPQLMTMLASTFELMVYGRIGSLKPSSTSRSLTHTQRHAPKTCPKDINDTYKMHEQMKKLKYEQRIREVEKASFNPLVFSCTGGAGPSASKVIKRIAGKLSDKKEDSYSDIITYIRTKISFALLRSSILCLRGSRSLRRREAVEASIGTVVEEGRLLI